MGVSGLMGATRHWPSQPFPKSYQHDLLTSPIDRSIIYSSHKLWPESSAKPQPEYVPAVIREDYVEACRIVDLSPKASATLARRCLQGMIRDFAGISKGTLFQEIQQLERLSDNGQAPEGVSRDSVEALNHVRKLGNIGAHMEKDINLIVSVDRDEAQVLLELIESLFDEWYVARHKRKARFAEVKRIAEGKEEMRKALPQSEVPEAINMSSKPDE